MVDASRHIRARVRHEPDRSYAVLVEGPDGDVLVGRTVWTSQVFAVAREGAARVFGVALEQFNDEHLKVVFPQPPYGSEGQLVRIVSGGESPGPGDLADLGAAGPAHWFGAESAWFVTVPGSGTGIYPSEFLDFDPVVTEEEAEEIERYLRSRN